MNANLQQGQVFQTADGRLFTLAQFSNAATTQALRGLPVTQPIRAAQSLQSLRTVPVTNGVRQGAVSSPTLFSVYINDLFNILKQSGLGCKIQNCYFGCFGYADDLLLLSASRSGLQAMVKIAEEFAKSRSLKFSTNPDPKKSKTKCLVFSKLARARQDILPILLNGDPLPWVDTVKHLGNKLESDNSMKQDIAMKKGIFIGKVNSLAQEFHFASSDVLMNILNTYCTSFHGSGLWELSSKESERLYKSWNVTMRITFSVPRTTHRYLIESISGQLHLKVMLASRLIKFLESLKTSSKLGVRFLAGISENDLRTVMRRNVANIATETGTEAAALTPGLVKKNMKYFRVPDDQKWRVPLLGELINENISIPGFSESELTDMKNYLCTS